MTILKPCPFCGERANEFEDGEIQCSNKMCFVRPGRCYDKTAWNTRAFPSADDLKLLNAIYEQMEEGTALVLDFTEPLKALIARLK